MKGSLGFGLKDCPLVPEADAATPDGRNQSVSTTACIKTSMISAPRPINRRGFNSWHQLAHEARSFEFRLIKPLATIGLVVATLPCFLRSLEIIDQAGFLGAGDGFEPPTFGL